MRPLGAPPPGGRKPPRAAHTPPLPPHVGLRDSRVRGPTWGFFAPRRRKSPCTPRSDPPTAVPHRAAGRKPASLRQKFPAADGKRPPFRPRECPSRPRPSPPLPSPLYIIRKTRPRGLPFRSTRPCPPPPPRPSPAATSCSASPAASPPTKPAPSSASSCAKAPKCKWSSPPPAKSSSRPSPSPPFRSTPW